MQVTTAGSCTPCAVDLPEATRTCVSRVFCPRRNIRTKRPPTLFPAARSILLAFNYACWHLFISIDLRLHFSFSNVSHARECYFGRLGLFLDMNIRSIRDAERMVL